MYAEDWYPVVVSDEKQRIRVELYKMPHDNLTALDEYEGPDFQRVSVSIKNTPPFWLYVATNPDDIKANRKPIPSGDWLAN